MFYQIKIITLTCMLMLVSAIAFAKLPKGVEKITSVEGITEYQLKNGLQVLLFPDISQETITVNITYYVGSKHENYGETGMAHLLEHLVFKGTPRHKDIPKELTDHGAEPNGTTWTDRTNYFETFAATDKNLNWALDLEADRMINSFIAKKDLDSEMTVVRNELENGENSPIRVLLQRMMAVSFDWHNYGKTTIGARSDLENVDIKNLKDFYRKYYQPDNATLVVAGKIDEAKVIKLVNKYFGKIKRPKRKIQELYTTEPIQDGERQVTVRRPGDVQVMAAMYRIPAGAHEDYPALGVLTQILADSKTGRLHENVVKKKLAAVTFGFPFQWAEPGLVTFMAQVAKDKDIDKTKDTVLDTLENIINNPITQTEVDNAKAKITKQFELRFNSSESIAKYLSEWVGMGDWRLIFLNRDRMEQVTVADVQKAAEEYLVNDNRTLGLFLPEQKPNRADSIVRLSQDEIKSMLADYKGRTEIAQGESFDSSHDNIDSRSSRNSLKNGAKTVYLPKKTRGESVSMDIKLDFGNVKDLWDKGIIGKLTGSMLNRGTDKYTREQLQAEFDKLKASVTIRGSAVDTRISISTTKPNLPAVLDLIEDIVKNPAFNQQELEVLKQEQIVSLEQQKQQPSAQVFRQLGRYLSPHEPGHPLYNMSIDDEIAAIKSVSTDELKNFHATFIGAQNADIGVVGDFDTDTIQNKLNQTIGNWSSKANYARVKSAVASVDSINQFIDTPDKAGAAFGAMLNFEMSDSHPDYPALKMANQMFGGGFISSRLADRLRRKDGLSYGAGSWFRASSYDEVAVFGAYAICAPENLGKVETGFFEEFDRMLKDGFTQQELDDARTGMLQNNKLDRAKDARLVKTLVADLDLDRNMQWDKNYEQKIRDLTVLQVNMAVRKYFKRENISIIKAGDATKITTQAE
ncbi:Zinc protease [hydrothermal vent metagenome]|uniref:Zinc protease n=1 Tax=hydrothermal vent metagenome TaxID=652676 RepID=A0A3B0VNQ8_9ZZZZ